MRPALPMIVPATLAALAACTPGATPPPTDGAVDSAADSAPDSADSTDSADTGSCTPVFPPLPGDSGGTDTGPEPLPELDRTGLVAEWRLEGDWTDSVGDLDLVPERSGGFSTADVAETGAAQAYGPTGESSGNGATSTVAPTPDLTLGLTMEGWYYKPDNNTKAVLFGFGSTTWNTPKLQLQDAWGMLYVVAGKTDQTVTYDRPTNGCWHHVALVLPAGVDTLGGEVALYVDGVRQTPTSTRTALDPGLDLLGGAFTAGTFSLPYGAAMRLDAVRLWSRPLTADEVAVAALPRGTGEVCPSAREPWEPGPRCTFAPGDTPATPVMTTELRVLDNQTLVVMSDPMPWLYDEMDTHCGTYLSAMEANLASTEDWWWQYQYHYALSDTMLWAWPTLQRQWADDAAWRVAGCDPGEEATVPAETVRWIAPTREARIPRVSPGVGVRHDSHAERLLVGYLRLPWPMREGATYTVQDRWGNARSLTYRSDDTLAWSIKVNQVGGPADDPGRRATIGAWLGPAGAMDVSRFAGQPFTVVDEADGHTALTGTIGAPRASTQTGETLLDLDLAALTTPGSYHVVVPGMGRSWSFTVGPDALGEAFYVHARGLYHNRCAELDPALTPWARGDIHTVYQAAFPPDDDDYNDHSAAGWGVLDAAGHYVSISHFDAVEATATTTRLAITGGWHDAGDFDRRPYHLGVVEDLLAAYELAPDHFTDGQLNLPESGNGVPDIVDEALFGMTMWRQAQRADGGVGTWIEATSHPAESDPGADTQPYYLSTATRHSSLDYARHAAMTGRILATLGDPEADGWIASAEAAWTYATSPAAHPAVSFTVDGQALRFVDQPAPDDEHRLWAAVELALATGDPAYTAVLEDLDGTYRTAVGNLWWKQEFMRIVAVGLYGRELPAGWDTLAIDAVSDHADTWMAGQAENAYPWAWYGPSHSYYTYWGWGQGRYRPLVDLVIAWKLTGRDDYRTAALDGLDVLLGLNPQGRVDTTGLGDHRTVTALHLPSEADAVDEASPGIPLYGALPSVAWQASQRVWGLSEGARSDPGFEGAAMPMLPPPWDPAAMTVDDVDATLDDLLPVERREVLLEESRPEEMEFTVWETTSPAAMVTGVLMDAGWSPSAALLDRAPLTGDALRQDLWGMP